MNISQPAQPSTADNNPLQIRMNEVVKAYLEGQKRFLAQGGSSANLNEGTPQLRTENIIAEFFNDPNGITFLASTSKIAWIYFYLKLLVQDNPLQTDIGNIEVNVGTNVFVELVKRDLSAIIAILKDSNLTHPLKDKLNELGVKLPEHKSESELLGALIGEVANSSRFPIKITLKQFIYMTLVLSSNSTIGVAIREVYSKLDPGLSIQERDSSVRKILGEEFLHFKQSGEEGIWMQPDANTGNVHEFALFFEKIYRERASNPVYSEMLEGLNKGHQVNQGKGFGQDFSSTEFARELKAKGWTIYEKTGYYPVVYWVENKSKNGPFMSVSTAILLVSPEGKTYPISFALEVAMPWPQQVEQEGDEKGLPAFESGEYTNSVKAFFDNVVGPYFRNKLEQNIRDKTNIYKE